MKTLYLTKSGGSTDLSPYSTTAEANALYAPIARAKQNKIIGGCHRVWQRAASYTAIASGSYVGDHWRYYGSHDGVLDVAQQALTGSDDLPFTHYTEFSVTTADTSIAAGQYANVTTACEGSDIADMQFGMASAQQITLSFWHKHTVTGTHTVAFRNGTPNRYYVAEYTQTTTDTWEKAEINLTADTGGTWLYTEASKGVQITWSLAAGSSFHATPDTWATGSLVSTSNQVNNLSSTSNKFCIGAIKFETNATATDYELRPFSEELALCKRYYEKSYPQGIYPGDINSSGIETFQLTGINAAAHIFGMNVRYQVEKAASGTVTLYSNTTGTSGKVYSYTDTADITGTTASATASGFKWGGTTGSAGNCNLAVQWECTAEIF